MKIVLLGGVSVMNKEWVDEIAQNAGDIFDEVVVQDFIHWQEEEKEFDLDLEVAQLEEISSEWDNYVVLAKSAGAITALKALSEGKISPKKLILFGLPYEWSKEQGWDTDKYLSDLGLPTLFVQKSEDWAMHYADLEKLVKDRVNAKFKLIKYHREGEIFSASTPLISCFETATDGTSSCTTGSSYLNTNGMVTVCGPDGCYDKARVEIDVQTNPSDTLYGLQISEDNFASDLRYIDGVTRSPIDQSDRTVEDYLTKTVWEATNTNIEGLESSTQYWIRAVALHGDFTESQPGQSADATTASASMNFDLDIAGQTGTTSESGPPFSISFQNETLIIATGPPSKALDLIWLDAETNAEKGFAILQKGSNGGLFSSTESYTIASDDADLDSITEGFGLQNFYSGQQYHVASGNGSLAAISIISEYSLSGNNVGQIDTSFLKVYQTDGPTKAGRMGLSLLARASGAVPPATDYTEELILVMVPKY